MNRIEEGIEGRLETAVLVLKLHPLKLCFPDVEVGLALGRKLGPVELGVHPGDAGAARFEALEIGSIADVVEAILAFFHAEAGRELGTKLQVLGEFLVEEGGETGIFGTGCRGHRRGLR